MQGFIIKGSKKAVTEVISPCKMTEKRDGYPITFSVMKVPLL